MGVGGGGWRESICGYSAILILRLGTESRIQTLQLDIGDVMPGLNSELEFLFMKTRIQFSS